MIARASHLRQSRGRRPRPPRFPMPGFPRGTAVREHRAAARSTRTFLSAHSTRAVSSAGFARSTLKTSSWGADLLAALAMGAGIFLWGGLLVLLAA